MASRIRRGYRAITIVVRDQDVAEAQRLADLLMMEGLSRADRSLVFRFSMIFLSDAVRGKEPQEILRLVLERARRVQPGVKPQNAA